MTNYGGPPDQLSDAITPEVAARIRELQALITEHQRKADKAEDEDIREAHNLQVSKLGLIIARLRRGQPEELPEVVEKAIEDEFEPLPQPTPEQLEEADKLIQRAMLEKRRGNKDVAAKLMEQAAEVAPGAASVLEAVGDDFVERRQFGAALEAYRSAHRADPKNIAIERKFAEFSSKGLTQLSVEDQLRMGSFDSPFINQDESMANPRVAVFLNVFIPGLGQFAMGRQKKAITFFAVFLVSLALFVALSYLILPPAPVDAQGHAMARPKGQQLPAWAYFPLAVALVTWFAALIDASTAAKSAGPRPPTKPNRPAPPVNLPFE